MGSWFQNKSVVTSVKSSFPKQLQLTFQGAGEVSVGKKKHKIPKRAEEEEIRAGKSATVWLLTAATGLQGAISRGQGQVRLPGTGGFSVSHTFPPCHPASCLPFPLTNKTHILVSEATTEIYCCTLAKKLKTNKKYCFLFAF